jgi:putative membrane protein
MIPIVVAILMVLPGRESYSESSLASLPLFHAVLNGSTAICLILGYYFIKSKQIKVHRALMLCAFILSSIFLVSYVVYHYSFPPTKFGGEGSIRTIYFFILISHIVLATTIVPLALFAIYYALSNQISKHKKVTKFTLPIWTYVSITGVLVYVLMSPYY